MLYTGASKATQGVLYATGYDDAEYFYDDMARLVRCSALTGSGPSVVSFNGLKIAQDMSISNMESLTHAIFTGRLRTR